MTNTVPKTPHRAFTLDALCDMACRYAQDAEPLPGWPAEWNAEKLHIARGCLLVLEHVSELAFGPTAADKVFAVYATAHMLCKRCHHNPRQNNSMGWCDTCASS
jgi:hypothetical protein